MPLAGRPGASRPGRRNSAYCPRRCVSRTLRRERRPLFPPLLLFSTHLDCPHPPPCLSPLRSQDVVVICGKGHEDYIDYGDGEGGVVRGWFDDRVEARNALSKLVYLDLLTKQGAVTRGMGMPWRDKYGD